MAREIETKLTDEEIDAQIASARARTDSEWALGLRATGAQYDASAGRLLLDLSNGHLLGIPIASLPALHAASPAQLASIELSPEGGALRVPDLDADYSIPALVRQFAERALNQPPSGDSARGDST